jgi:pilus assembly protein CpaE
MPVARVRSRAAAPACPAEPAAAERRRTDDRGSSSVEVVLLFPIIVVLLLAGPQLAMWYYARQAAEAAGAAGARAGSTIDASAGDGAAAGEQYLATLSTGTISSYHVTETDTATTVIIHVHASVPNVIPLPGFSPTVDVTVIRQRERFTTPDSP